MRMLYFDKEKQRNSFFLSDLVIIDNKKRACRIVGFTVQADHSVKLKENEKRDNYQALARELKNCEAWKRRLYKL